MAQQKYQNQYKVEGEQSYSKFGKYLQRKMKKITVANNSSPIKSESDQNENPQNTQSNKKYIIYTNLNIKKNNNTSSFLSVNRQKKCNFRFPIRLCRQQIKYKPNFFYGSSKSPEYSFSKDSKSKKQKVVEYQICKKNSLCKNIKAQSFIQKNQLSPIRMTSMDFMPKNSRIKNNSLMTTTSNKFKYSIIQKKEQSNIQKYHKSKISNPLYVSQQQLLNSQLKQQIQSKNQKISNIFIQLDKFKMRQPNLNKQFALTQSHFNNFKYSKDIANHIHNFDSYPSRPSFPDNHSPVYDILKINYDKIREDTKKGNIFLKKFRDKITTRYDRMEPEPNTRLDYQYDSSILPGVPRLTGINMQQMMGRNPELFPIVDPNLKKQSDKLMTKQLKKQLKDPFQSSIYI